MPHDCGFVDRRLEDVSIVRAMREFSRKEVALYNQLRSLPQPVVVPTFSTMKSTFESVERQVKSVISRN